jgi:hypothetical protein
MDEAIAKIMGIQKEIQRGDAMYKFMSHLTKEEEEADEPEQIDSSSKNID